ncbi:MAG TPA: TetR/AcrR family transcriptional regulator [Longilinea sp.]|nr:TetR/AcrR family transcriptional regulator [Longilinea sp.]
MSSETYQKILNTAHDLFIKQGYTATSMRQIAEEAGIGKATIYHHFPDKQTIVLELLKSTMTRMDEALQMVKAESEPRRRIQVAVGVSLKYLLESADIMQIVRREVPGGRDQMNDKFLDFFHSYISLLSDAVHQGTEQGIFRSVDPDETARTLMTMIQGTFSMAYLGGGKPHSPQKTIDSLLDVYFQGIEVR